mgnify:CR=1 FL=1
MEHTRKWKSQSPTSRIRVRLLPFFKWHPPELNNPHHFLEDFLREFEKSIRSNSMNLVEYLNFKLLLKYLSDSEDDGGHHSLREKENPKQTSP